jgi:hypothetical protein
MRTHTLLLAATLALAGAAQAKLPPPTEEQAAKAAEAKAKAAEAEAKAAAQLAASQDQVAARWIAAQKARGVAVVPTPMAPPAPAAAAPAAAK